MDRTSACLLLQPLRPFKAMPDTLRTQRLGDVLQYAAPGLRGWHRTSTCSLLQPLRPFEAMPTFCALRGSQHFAICGVRTASMDTHFDVLTAAAFEAIQSHADSLCTERLGAFRNMRRQDCEDGTHFSVLADCSLQGRSKPCRHSAH